MEDKLTKFNEWWITKKVKESLLEKYKRPLFFDILRYLDRRQIILITGLRRVGKTTLMYQLIQELLDKKTDSRNIIYFSFDEDIVDFDNLIKIYEDKVLKQGLRERIKEGRIYIFLDEIQKCKNWQNKIKILYDLYPKLKFIISGSASVQIDKKAKESLAGRIFDFLLQPLMFEEFLEWKSIKVDKGNLEIFQREALPYFYDYLRKGGFPEIVDEDEDEKIKSYIKNTVIERIIYRDLPEEFGARDYELLKTLVEMIAVEPGMIVNYDSLSRKLHRDKRTIMNYFFYLEYSMLIKLIANYRKGFLVSSRKLRKVYIGNTSISFGLVEAFYSNRFLEKIYENYAIIETGARNYYRNSYEIDIVLKKDQRIIPIEIKFGEADTDAIFRFLSEFDIKKGIVLTKDIFDKKTNNKKEILLVPLWAFSIMKEKYLMQW
ncbi:ATP-binding protein [Candidatus Woesearchaeota archaeon]|nr:ATP-binding protein [Candidatus Woesearchaeota archaeon]